MFLSIYFFLHSYSWIIFLLLFLKNYILHYSSFFFDQIIMPYIAFSEMSKLMILAWLLSLRNETANIVDSFPVKQIIQMLWVAIPYKQIRVKTDSATCTLLSQNSHAINKGSNLYTKLSMYIYTFQRWYLWKFLQIFRYILTTKCLHTNAYTCLYIFAVLNPTTHNSTNHVT